MIVFDPFWITHLNPRESETVRAWLIDHKVDPQYCMHVEWDGIDTFNAVMYDLDANGSPMINRDTQEPVTHDHVFVTSVIPDVMKETASAQVRGS